MLEKMIITNFKSFKNKTVFDFTKTNYGILPGNVSESGILKGAIFVGANASGKSTVLAAIECLLDYLFGEKSVDFTFDRCIFSSNPKYELDYYFLIDGQHIRYDIILNTKQNSIQEYLYMNNDILLRRMGVNAESFIADPNGVSYDETDIDRETLFLRTLYFNTKFTTNPVLKKWMAFLAASVCLDAYTRQIINHTKQPLLLQKYLKENGVSEINSFFENRNFDQRIEYSKTSKGNLTAISVQSDDETDLIFFKRNGIEEPIPFQLESQGNQNLLQMLPSFFWAINHSCMLLIDEFSSGFHNELESLLIKFFMTNASESQLFIVSHSTNLLTNSLLRPDQEYSVDFSGKEGSYIKRFSSEQPRLAQNVEKMYVSGVFGGLPHYNKE